MIISLIISYPPTYETDILRWEKYLRPQLTRFTILNFKIGSKDFSLSLSFSHARTYVLITDALQRNLILLIAL